MCQPASGCSALLSSLRAAKPLLQGHHRAPRNARYGRISSRPRRPSHRRYFAVSRRVPVVGWQGRAGDALGGCVNEAAINLPLAHLVLIIAACCCCLLRDMVRRLKLRASGELRVHLLDEGPSPNDFEVEVAPPYRLDSAAKVGRMDGLTGELEEL